MNFKEVVLVVVLALLLAGVGLFIENILEAPTTSTNQPRIESIIVKRTDTIKVLDTVLQTKIKYIKTAPDTVIVQKFDSIFTVDDSDTAKALVTIGQERKCLECNDSLGYYKARSKIDSATLDSVTKLIAEEGNKKACSLKEQAKSFGLGTLFGVTIRSLF